MSDNISDDVVERAAIELQRRHEPASSWDEISRAKQWIYRRDARAILAAAFAVDLGDGGIITP
jgi:hypothetical protein